MTNQVTVRQRQSTELSPYGAFAAEADSVIRGDLVLFKKGIWTRGNRPLADGSIFIANLDEGVRGWQRWFDSRPAEHRLERIVGGNRLPMRDELGHLDQDQWETDRNGEPKDPWSMVYFVALRDARTGADATFSTSSWGGQRGIRLLYRDFDLARARHPNLWPVLKPSSESRPHKSYGMIMEPRFVIVGWAEWGNEGDRPVVRSNDECPEGAPPPNYDIDDVIPFAPEWRA
jgi:hypothetical protein